MVTTIVNPNRYVFCDITNSCFIAECRDIFVIFDIIINTGLLFDKDNNEYYDIETGDIYVIVNTEKIKKDFWYSEQLQDNGIEYNSYSNIITIQ